MWHLDARYEFVHIYRPNRTQKLRPTCGGLAVGTIKG
jgi:hypothetical protein